MKYGGFPGHYHQTSPCYCYRHDIPRRNTPVAVSSSLHFTPLWTLIRVLGLSYEKIHTPLIGWICKMNCHGKWIVYSWMSSTSFKAQPQAQFSGVDHESRLSFGPPVLRSSLHRKESTKPSLRHLHNYSSSPAPARHSPARQSICLFNYYCPSAPARLAPARSTSPRTLSLRWQTSLVLW